MDKETLGKMTVAELRELAKKIPDVKGISSMKKDALIELVSEHGNGEKTAGKPKAPKAKASATPTDRPGIKQYIRTLKAEKQEAISRQDKDGIKRCNRLIHNYKRKLRKMAKQPQKK